jgi:hypothetical protein
MGILERQRDMAFQTTQWFKRYGPPANIPGAKNTDFYRLFVLGALLNSSREQGVEIPQDNSFTNLVEWFQFQLLFHSIGCPVFRLTHGLAAQLILTDCTSLRGDDLKFPFDAFAVSVPPGLFRLLDKERKEHDVVVVQVYRHLTSSIHRARFQGKGMTLVELISNTPKPEEHDGAETVIRMLTATSSIDCYHRSKIPTGDQSIERWLDPPQTCPLGSWEVPSEDLDHESLLAASRLVANLSIWLSANRTRVHQGSEQLCLGPSDSPKLRTWTLGHEIKVPSDLYEEAGRASSSGPRWKLASRFVVRGHWKHQVCGAGGSERKLIWVAPYWKGPKTDKERLERTYCLEGDGNGAVEEKGDS